MSHVQKKNFHSVSAKPQTGENLANVALHGGNLAWEKQKTVHPKFGGGTCTKMGLPRMLESHF